MREQSLNHCLDTSVQSGPRCLLFLSVIVCITPTSCPRTTNNTLRRAEQVDDIMPMKIVCNYTNRNSWVLIINEMGVGWTSTFQTTNLALCGKTAFLLLLPQKVQNKKEMMIDNMTEEKEEFWKVIPKSHGVDRLPWGSQSQHTEADVQGSLPSKGN